MNQTADDIIQTTCGMCFSCCGILVHVKKGRAVKIVGDPQSPVNKGSICLKARSALEMLYHPQRLIFPLKRTGARGQGKWEKISWEEAFEYTAYHLNQAKKEEGPHSVAVIQGTTKGLIDVYTERLVNAFGTPNLSTSGHVCFLPRLFAGKITHGFFPVPDYDGHPDCIILWGADLSKTRQCEHQKLIQAIQNGSKCIVIDPMKTSAAKKAHLHLPVLPGTDLILALGFIHIIISEQLYDKAFVDQWCVGFEELKHHAARYPLEKVAKITKISEKDILEAAIFYATAQKAVIQWGNAIDHGPNSFATARAISILRALTGHLDKLGSDLEPMYPVTGANGSKATLSDLMTSEIWQTNISSARNHLSWFRRVLPADIVKAVNTGRPYKISSLYVCGSNPIMTFSNSINTFEALNKVDFLAVSDRFMTPTASLADVILPPATFLEYESIIAPPYYPNVGLQQKVVHINGALSDFDITTRLAKHLGLGHLFYENIHDFFDLILEPSKMTFQEFKKIKTLSGERKEQKYLSQGFSTPSSKVEFYSKQLLNSGLSPLPDYIQPCNLSKEYPLIMTCRKSGFFRHSDNRQINRLRSADSEPIARIHPQTALQFNIKDGDMINIKTARGKIYQKAKVTDDIRPDVLLADFGWWFPEKDITQQNWQQANINMLTSDEGPFSPEIGSPNFRSIPCTISPVQ